MKKTSGGFFEFLAHQSVYPLVLSSGLAVTFYIARVVYANSWNYNNLLWNLVLAWVPYTFSFLAATFYRLSPRQRWPVVLMGLPWLVFFPNAPYMITDFYHLAQRPPVPFWYDIGLITIFTFAGLFLAIASLRTMHQLVEAALGKVTGWLFAIMVLSLAGLGVYLGRFGRYNSWDLLIQPRAVLKDIAIQLLNPLDNLGFVGFTLMFTSIMIVFYLMFVSVNRIESTKNLNQRGKDE